jgi:hypothetical protein
VKYPPGILGIEKELLRTLEPFRGLGAQNLSSEILHNAQLLSGLQNSLGLQRELNESLRRALGVSGLSSSFQVQKDLTESLKRALGAIDIARPLQKALQDMQRAQDLNLGGLHRELMASMAGAMNKMQEIQGRSLTAYLSDLRVSEIAQRSTLTSALESAVGNWSGALGPNFISDLEESVLRDVDENPEATVGESVSNAVLEAIGQSKFGSSWTVWFPLLVSILFFLSQKHDSNVSERQRAHDAAVVESAIQQQLNFLHLLLTKDVTRWSRLYSRPSVHSTLLGKLSPGMTVILLRRKGRWSLVGLSDADDVGAGAVRAGWVYNKYLK